jgi:DNA helicase-2/ATP-dependent DNA helicase PcrA
VVTNSPKVSAEELSRVLGIHPPTAEQKAIIEAPLEGVYRVVAGAGSGKTETMALRVVWLVANDMVSPQQILGLTFTRKAASELGGRITSRIRQLPQSGGGETIDVFAMPQVSTYNAFASRLFQDYAVYLGIDGDQDVAGAAAAWALAKRTVAHSRHEALPDLQMSLDQLTSLTWQLSQALSENAVDTEALRDYAESFQSVRELPAGGRGGYPGVDRTADNISLLPVLIDLVEEFRTAKYARGIVEYSDQVRLGLEVARSAPEVVQGLRSRHAVVLLDEYQDTSVLQTTLLKTLFADHPVMSVGDPLQAIYGWRGASAANLDDFPREFAHQWPARTFGLQTSWRNPSRVLAAANALCAPLRTDDLQLGELSPAPHAAEGSVDVHYPDTLDDEAEAVAQWFAKRLSGGPDPAEGAPSAPGSTPAPEAPSAALLLRERKHQHVYARALERRGIPVHILGIGGLLGDPLVADLVAGLAIVHRPFANGELVRLLTSGRFRLGASDLFALAERARWLGLRDSAGGRLDESLDQALREQALGQPSASLLDALEYLAQKPPEHSHWEAFSADARTQLLEAAALIARQRRLSHESIADQVVHWERATGVDIEWLAHPHRESYRNSREAFFAAISQYQAFADEAGAKGFLDWLEQAEWRDSLQPQSAPPEPGCVQILTIHGAKGLEWDLVAVGQLVEGELPGTPNEGFKGWLRQGVLPYPFRGDSEFLPHFDWRSAESRKDLLDRIEGFSDDIRAHHEREERRLAYVAMTRARAQLLLAGSFYSTKASAQSPSPFLVELEAAHCIDPLPLSPSSDNPLESAEEDLIIWPADPLGSRRDAIEQAAAAVSAAIERASEPATEQGVEQVDAALVEQLDAVLASEQRRLAPAEGSWPVRIPASQFDRWVYEPEVMLRSRIQPRPPTTGLAQQRGNDFHAWVESYFHSASGNRVLGDIDIDHDTGLETDLDVQTWRESFERSEFAALTPIALEREIHLPLAGHLVICKIDAVFDRGDRIQIVDWKTGRTPQDPAEIERKALQLALYRLAWAEWAGVEIDTVDAVFWFSQSEQVITPERLAGREELEALIDTAKAVPAGQTTAAQATAHDTTSED